MESYTAFSKLYQPDKPEPQWMQDMNDTIDKAASTIWEFEASKQVDEHQGTRAHLAMTPFCEDNEDPL